MQQQNKHENKKRHILDAKMKIGVVVAVSD